MIEPWWTRTAREKAKSALGWRVGALLPRARNPKQGCEYSRDLEPFPQAGFHFELVPPSEPSVQDYNSTLIIVYWVTYLCPSWFQVPGGPNWFFVCLKEAPALSGVPSPPWRLYATRRASSPTVYLSNLAANTRGS